MQNQDRMQRRGVLRGLSVAGLAIAVFPGLAACDPTQFIRRTTSKAVSEADSAAVTITMDIDHNFLPNEVTVTSGETVTWHNATAVFHTATCDPARVQNPAVVQLPPGAEPWDSGDIGDGEAWSRRFDTPGQYVYVCIHHEFRGMIGIVNVI